MKVPNPWLKLPASDDSYVLDIDRQDISAYNESRHGAGKVIEGSLPEPFIGNPETAKVVLLNLNPGHSESDKDDYRNDDFEEAIVHNLRHEPQEYPFYPLNPAFSDTGAGKWWRTHTRGLQRAADVDDMTLANSLLVIEWFPYHSKKSALPAERLCESQKYSFQLAGEMLERGRPIVLMRAKEQWIRVHRQLEKESPPKEPKSLD